jgi:hypothetical protein
MRDPSIKKLAEVAQVHSVIVEGDTLYIQVATADTEWADIWIPISEAQKLAGYLARLPWPGRTAN